MESVIIGKVHRVMNHNSFHNYKSTISFFFYFIATAFYVI